MWRSLRNRVHGLFQGRNRQITRIPRRWVLPLSLVLFLSGQAKLHCYPIYPVDVELKVEEAHIRARMRTHYLYWQEGLLGLRSLPASDWPQDIVRKCETYINSNFRLRVNDREVPGSVLSARFVKEPWNAARGGNFVFSVEYPLPRDARMLRGEASFFEEHRRELLAAGIKGEDVNPSFMTLVSIPGRKRTEFRLSPESRSFEVSIRDAARTRAQSCLESFRWGLAHIFGSGSLALFLAAGILFLPGRREAAAGISGLLLLFTAFYASGFALPKTLSMPLCWAAVLVMAVVSRSRARAAWWIGTLWLSAPAWAMSSVRSVDLLLPAGGPRGLERFFFMAGLWTMAALIGAALWGLVSLDRKSLEARSQSLAGRLHASRLRFYSDLAFGAGAYYLAKSALGG